MAYGAIIDKNDYPHLRAAPKSWTAWIYDLEQPRMPEHDDPHFHFVLVEALGPFPTLTEAEAEADQRIKQ